MKKKIKLKKFLKNRNETEYNKKTVQEIDKKKYLQNLISQKINYF